LQSVKGAYIVAKDENPDVVLVANGSEVSTLYEAAQILKSEGIRSQIVSAPSLGLYAAQPQEYKDTVIPQGLPIYGLTAGLPSTLWPIVGSDRGLIHGLDHFGHSAPYKVLDEKLGFTPQLVAEEIKKFLGK
jgi:transketolase